MAEENLDIDQVDLNDDPKDQSVSTVLVVSPRRLEDWVASDVLIVVSRFAENPQEAFNVVEDPEPGAESSWKACPPKVYHQIFSAFPGNHFGNVRVRL